MAGPGGAATVVIAQPDDAARELLARVVEAAGHIAVRLDASAPPDVVDATVEASANLLLVDLASTSHSDLTAVIDALAVRRFPAHVVALVDGPASGELAVAAGAAQFLARPFHQRDLATMLTALLDPNQDKHADPTAAIEPDAEASLLSAIHKLPPIDELADFSTVDHESAGAGAGTDDPDESVEPGQSEPGETNGTGTDNEPVGTDQPDAPDQPEPSVEADEPEPGASPRTPTVVPDTFTDILKMGRQL